MNKTIDPIVIVSALRTPIGSMLGTLSCLSATDLGAHVIHKNMAQTQLSADDIDAVYMGCVLQAGIGQAPARQAAIKGGLNKHTPCTTINKMCGSGLQSLIFAHDALLLGRHDIAIAGGMESMSNAPYLVPKARDGYRLGHGQLIDHMFYDGLEDVYESGTLMGVFAERTAKKFSLSRKVQDDFAIRSLTLAKQAAEDGKLTGEIVPISITHRKKTTEIYQDELPQNAKIDKIPSLKPVFDTEGTVTAANSSAISDGAASLVLMRRSEAKRRNLTILATIEDYSIHAHEPSWFTTAPISAIEKLFAQTGWSAESVELFEINEAFAAVSLAAIQSLQLDPDKVNIFGGACALGHPIGASGARIITTLINAMHQRDVERGVAAICIGGGEALALALTREST